MFPASSSHRELNFPFVNHTPRAFEVEKSDAILQNLPSMFGPMGMAVGPVILPSSASAPSTTHTAKPSKTSVINERSSVIDSVAPSCASSSSNKEDVKPRNLEESGTRATPSKLDMEGESETPFVDDTRTQTNLLVLPPSNPSFQMAHFLKTTGPAKEPPVKSSRSKRMSSAMRIFKSSSRRPSENLTAAHDRLNEVIAEEPTVQEEPLKVEQASSETKLPETVVPKVSKNGKKYFDIDSSPSETTVPREAPASSSRILDSNVSVFVTDQLSTDSLHDWVLSFEGPEEPSVGRAASRDHPRGRKPRRTSIPLRDEETIRVLDGKTLTPVKPLFLGAKARLENPEDNKNVRTIRGKVAPLRSHPVDQESASVIKSASRSANQGDEKLSDQSKTKQLAHPRPRRLYSNPSLLQRASSDVSGARFSQTMQDGIRPISDSPGPPPPRSPLRVSMQSQSLDKMLNKPTKTNDDDKMVAELNRLRDDHAIHVTKEAAVTYLPREKGDFDHPTCLRPGSRAATSTNTSDVFCSHTTQAKIGSSKSLELIDAMRVKASQQNTSRRRLRRGRPEGSRPRDLDTKSAQDFQDQAQESEAHCTSPLSLKQGASIGDMNENYRVIATTASPSPRVSHVRKAPVARGRRSPAPRPKTAKRGRSMKSVTSTSRAGSPKKTRQVATPDLPSPPPKKELPPTPSERRQRLSQSTFSERLVDATTATMARANSVKALPSLPVDRRSHTMVFPSPPSSAKTAVSRIQPLEQSALNLETRMEELERRNRLLEAALLAVLKTGGKMNGCPCHEKSQECPDAMREGSFIANGSVRSRVSSMGSGPSALDMYLTTRGK